MTLVDLLILLVVAGVCGSVAQAIVGNTRGGCLGSIAIGFIGALIGVWLARKLGFPEFFSLQIGGQAFPIIWSIVGAVIFVAVVSLVTRRTGMD